MVQTLKMKRSLLLLVASQVLCAAQTWGKENHCGLNGELNASSGRCECDVGWRGSSCSEIDLLPASPAAFGLVDDQIPTWGGGAVFEDGHWHLIVGARAVASSNDTLTDYPCDSKIVRAASSGSDPAGPYSIVQTLFPRSSWEPGLARGPNGELLVMFFGNITNPPPVGSPECLNRSLGYNLTTTNTYISISKSGSAKGPWTEPQLVKGMENSPLGKDAYHWRCASGNPSPAWHPNGTLYAAMRHDPCWRNADAWKPDPTREHIGIWRADHGWDGEWTAISDQPIFGWGNGSEFNCTEGNQCPSHEDPHLWWDHRGAHILTHDQNNYKAGVFLDRGAYGWSLDGHNWVLETGPIDSNASAWDMFITWTNGSVTSLVRRQRPSFIRDVDTNKPTHLINGADFHRHTGPGIPHFCEGCHWGNGVTLIQPIKAAVGGDGSNQPAGRFNTADSEDRDR